MANNGKKWSLADVVAVNNLLIDGVKLDEIANHFNRTSESIIWQAIKYIQKNKIIPDTYNDTIINELEKIPYYIKNLTKYKNLESVAEESESESESESDESEKEYTRKIVNIKKIIIEKLELTIHL
jgi:hypothetical protein